MRAPIITPANMYGKSFLSVVQPSLTAYLLFASKVFGKKSGCIILGPLSKIISFSTPIKSISIPQTTPSTIPETAYSVAKRHPNIPPIITNATSLTSGDVIKNENATPAGTPALMNPMKIGIEEQEQNGVTAPNIEAIRLPDPYLAFAINAFVFPGAKNVLMKAITVTTAKTSVKILIESYIKK